MRYFYIFSLSALFLEKLYSTGNIKKELWQILLCFLLPFLYGFFVKMLVKTKNMLKLKPVGARKKRMYTLFLAVAAAAVFLAGSVFVKKQPFLYSGGVKERFYDFARQIERMGTGAGGILVFLFPFAVFPTLNSIKKQQDVRAILWLFMADIFALTGMFSFYGRVCWYGFLVVSIILSLQYFRLYYRELYGDAVIDIPKKAKKPGRKKKRKKKKHIAADGGRRQAKKSQKSTKQMTAPKPTREFCDNKKTKNQKKLQISDGKEPEIMEPENCAEEIELSDIERMLEQNAENTRKEALLEFEADLYQERE